MTANALVIVLCHCCALTRPDLVAETRKPRIRRRADARQSVGGNKMREEKRRRAAGVDAPCTNGSHHDNNEFQCRNTALQPRQLPQQRARQWMTNLPFHVKRIRESEELQHRAVGGGSRRRSFGPGRVHWGVDRRPVHGASRPGGGGVVRHSVALLVPASRIPRGRTWFGRSCLCGGGSQIVPTGARGQGS
jgi:hypothetical protein